MINPDIAQNPRRVHIGIFEIMHDNRAFLFGIPLFPLSRVVPVSERLYRIHIS